MRKVFALCLTLVLACAWLLIPVQAEEPDGSGAPVTVVAEDFEAYELDDPLLTGLGVEFGGGNWVSNAYRMGEGEDPAEADFGISNGESGDLGWTNFDNELGTKALALETAATWNRYEYFPTVANKKLTMRSENSYTITTDLYVGHYATGAAIRLFAHNPNQDGLAMNFYMLYFPGANVDDGQGQGCRLIKFENGVAEYLYIDPNTGPIQSVQWYTLNLTYENGNFSWSCVPKDGNYRSFSGSAADPEPFADIEAPFEYAAGGQVQMYAYFDNLTITEEAGTQEEPPAEENVLIDESFEDYQLDDPLLTGRNVRFADNKWVSNSLRMGEGSVDEAHFGISEGESGDLGWTNFDNELGTKALALETAASWNRYSLYPTVSPVGITMRTENAYTITTDLYVGHYVTGAGIRLFAHNPGGMDNTEQNFYMLYFSGENAKQGCQLIKCVNGTSTVVWQDPDPTSIQQLQWYTLNLTYKNGTFTWTCVPKPGGLGGRSFEGSWTDPDPFTGVSAPFEYAAGGQKQMYAYYDNLKIIEEEIPDPTEELVTEDFEAYELNDPLLTGLGVEFGDGNWVSNAYRMGEGEPTEADFGISDGETWNIGGSSEKNEIGTKALAIETAASWNMYPYFPTVSSTNVTMRTENTYNITTDLYVGHYLTGAAIRLFAHNPNPEGMAMNFYMLYFPGTNAGGNAGCQFVKYEDGISTILYQDSDTSTMQQLTWYTLNLTVDNGTFTWTCVPKSGSYRSFSGSVTDPEPFTGVAAPFEYAAGGQAQAYVYFDNLTITTENPYVIGAPDNALYADVLRNRAVIAAEGDNPAAVNDGDTGTAFTGSSLTVDLGLQTQLRGLEAAGLTASADVRVKTSANGQDWQDWLTLSDGRQYSTAARYDVRYVRLESDAAFSVADVKVLSDAARMPLRLGQKLYLYPRLGGADVTDASYSFAQEQLGFAVVEDNVLTPSSQTSSLTLTAEKDGQRAQVEIVILAKAALAGTEDNTLTIETGCDYLTEGGEYLFAFYDDQDRLIGVAEGTSAALNGNAENTTVTVTPPEAIYDHVQMFCWDGGWNGLRPLTEAVSF